MRFTINRMPIGLSTTTPLSIDDACGSTLRVLRGRVWVTQEGCGDDVFLDPGCSYRFRREGRVIVSVEGGADAAATVLFDGRLSIQSVTGLHAMLRRWFSWRPATVASTTALGCP